MEKSFAKLTIDTLGGHEYWLMLETWDRREIVARNILWYCDIATICDSLCKGLEIMGHEVTVIDKARGVVE